MSKLKASASTFVPSFGAAPAASDSSSPSPSPSVSSPTTSTSTATSTASTSPPPAESWDAEEPSSSSPSPPNSNPPVTAPSSSNVSSSPSLSSSSPAVSSSPSPSSPAPSTTSSSPSPSPSADSKSPADSDNKAKEQIPSTAASTLSTSSSSPTPTPIAAAPTGNSTTAVGGRNQSSTSFHTLKAHDVREHVNIVFIGHVDAGKSTISGQILLQTGQVDERTIQKYEKEAKEKNRESWYLAYIMDTNEEERAKGKTVEVGRAHFTTKKKRYTVLDAPGHKNYVPNMIGGAAQADVGVLVISARKGEFEAGFDRGGQTREHAMLAKTLGIQKLIVLVNKMDEPQVKWSEERYAEIEGKLAPFLKKCGFNLKNDVIFLPASGYAGINIGNSSASLPTNPCPWYKEGKSLFEILDDLPSMTRDEKAGLRLPIMAKYKDMGATFALGKLETGTLVKDTKLIVMPTKQECICIGITVDETEVDVAKPGENVLVRLKGVDDDELQEGYVLSYPDAPCKRSKYFEAQIAILELLDHKMIITAGYSCVLHCHVLTADCVISHLVSGIDKKTGEPTTKVTFLKSNDFATVRIKTDHSIAIEEFKNCAPLGRFMLRDEGKTIAIGKFTKIKEDP